MRSAVTFRAFRGTRRSSVYREHELPAAAFERLRRVAEREGMPVLTSLGREPGVELDRGAARRLAAEVSQIRTRALLLDLDDELTAVAEVANWCARAGGSSWLRVGR